ncbi:MAG: aminotransferase class III-fold pyridoxal phosphate-dependent enzyme [bacterium]
MSAKIDIRNSREWWARAEKRIPCGTQTLSKAPNQFVRGVSPIFLERGQGAHVWDVDGNEYIDYPMALGPIILGHAYPRVIDAVAEQMRLGTTFTLMHPLEVELTELLCDVIPCAEMVRFGKNGSDVTTAAVRVARAVTGRDKIAYCGYHGWQDWYAAVTERNKGVPEILRCYMVEFQYNDPESLTRIFDQSRDEIAAVIMEQPGTEPKDGFLHETINLAHKNGAVFILDEIVTGFRYALGGAQEYYGIAPDLACFGKGMSNGFPLSALVGKREFMRELENVFFSMTYGGETVSLRAAMATITEIRENQVIERIWETGRWLRSGLEHLIRELGVNAALDGNPPRSGLTFYDRDGKPSLLLKSLFLQETVKRGVLFGGPIFVTYSHTTEDIEKTLVACEAAFKRIKQAVEENAVKKYLEGEPMSTVFKAHAGKPKLNGSYGRVREIPLNQPD